METGSGRGKTRGERNKGNKVCSCMVPYLGLRNSGINRALLGGLQRGHTKKVWIYQTKQLTAATKTEKKGECLSD